MAVSPVLFAVVAMLAWGLWAVLANVAAESLAPTTAMILSYATGVVVALGYVVVRDESVALSGEGVAFALAAGVFSGIGAVAFYAGLEQGRTGVVTTVSALYFVVAAVVGVAVLGESLELTDAAGVGFAVVAVLLLAR